MQKFNLLKIAAFLFIATVILISVVFFIADKKTELRPDNKIPLNQTFNSETKPETPPEQNNIPYRISRQKELSSEILQQDSHIAVQTQKILSTFKISDMATSAPSSVVSLDNGKKILLLWGCVPDNCGGTTKVIAHDQTTDDTYILAENISSDREYDIFGDPPKEVLDLMIYYYIHP